MKLSQLLKQYSDIPLDADGEIAGLAIDSRKIKPHYVFFAYEGTHNDGRHYIDDAIANGASAILVEGDEKSIYWQDTIPFIVIPQLRKKMAELAAHFYHYPAKALQIIGITGTNGKTSCSHFIASSLERLGTPCGVIGTLGNGLYGQLQETVLTTPDPITLHALFAEFVLQSAKVVAMEVSSHSLDQGRVQGIDFAIGIFTNLTQDHLDYHGSMENYGKAKQKLFEQAHYAVINADDAFGQMLIDTLPKDRLFTYSTENPHVQIYASHIHLALTGIRAIIVSPWGKGEITVPLIGKFNLSNVLAAFTTLCLMGIPFKRALESLSQLTPVPGRMEILGGDEQPLVAVDYSHTPDSLEKALIALRQHCQGKLYCLFGCGGDRDKKKRPLMAKIAEKLADVVMVTDDNPRTEGSRQIIDDILVGFLEPTKIMVQSNRAKAIADILSFAKAGDCVLIAGRGGEIYQQIGTEKIPFSDIQVARECLRS